LFWTSYALGLLYPRDEGTTNLRNATSYLPVAPKLALLLFLADVSSQPPPHLPPILGFFLLSKRVTEEDKGASEFHHGGIFEGPPAQGPGLQISPYNYQ